MNKKVLLPLALSALTILLNGCGGESANINEDPTKGVKGVTKNTSCDVKADDCLRFVMDYPIAGLNFDCSSDTVNHFITKLETDAVAGACRLGDNVSFYIQGEDSPNKISLGTIKLDDISKIKLNYPARIRLMDLAMAMTGKSTLTALDENEETTRAAMALVKIFQSIGVERNSNLVGDIQPTEITNTKKELLSTISKDIGSNELVNGTYIDILKPWLDVTDVSDAEAFSLLNDLVNLSNTGVLQADLPVLKAGSEDSTINSGSSVRPDGFFGCNKLYKDCVDATGQNGINLLHSMGRFELLTDRQGYTFGYGQQWRGNATITNGIVSPPLVLLTVVKPVKLQIDAQTGWFNPVSRSININQPLRLRVNDTPTEDVLLKQGKMLSASIIAGTEGLYRQTTKAKESDPFNNGNDLGLWQQAIGGVSYNGVLDILKINTSNYLLNKIFSTEENVPSGGKYVFPLYATLTFSFQDTSIPAVNVGIVIDEKGDIRTDIKPNPTATDKSGVCATVKALNADGTITDSNDQIQYRVGTTGATLSSTNDKSITVRMIFSNPKFGNVDGAAFGLNTGSSSGAKINVANLLLGQATGINLTNFSDKSVVWQNNYALYQSTYVNLYDDKDTDKSKYEAPTAAERELIKRITGTVTIKVADQALPACKSIHVKS